MDGSITVGQEKESGDKLEWVGTTCSRIRFLLGLQPYYCVYIYIHQQGRKEASTEQTSTWKEERKEKCQLAMKRRKIPNPQQQLGQIYVLPRRRQPHRGLHAAPSSCPWTPSPTSYPQRPLVPHRLPSPHTPRVATGHLRHPRHVSRSLDGLVTLLRAITTTGDTLSKHEAVVHAM